MQHNTSKADCQASLTESPQSKSGHTQATDKSSRPARKRKRRKSRKSSRRATLGSFPLATGKFAGHPLRAVPRKYLVWMIETKAGSASDLWAIGEFLRGDHGGTGK